MREAECGRCGAPAYEALRGGSAVPVLYCIGCNKPESGCGCGPGGRSGGGAAA